MVFQTAVVVEAVVSALMVASVAEEEFPYTEKSFRLRGGCLCHDQQKQPTRE